MPAWAQWYWYLNPIAWTLYAIIITQVRSRVMTALWVSITHEEVM